MLTRMVRRILSFFFKNYDYLGFDFGVRQNGQRVMDVRLPTWACNDPRLFVFIHRQV